MNAQLTVQGVRESWGMPVSAMLHERSQPGRAPLEVFQASLFDHLERQMKVQEEEFTEAMADLRKQFMFVNRASVAAFLKSHRALVPILLEAAPHLATFFGQDTPLALEIMADDGPPASINALALYHGESVEARAALEGLDTSWWLENSRKAGGRIVFDYDLI